MPRLVHSTTTHPSPRPGRIATPGLEARRAAGWRASRCGRLPSREGARPEVTQSSALPSSRAARGPGVALRAFPRRGARAGLRRPLERGCAGRRERHEAQGEEGRGAREALVHRHAPERAPAVRHRNHGRRPDDVRAVLGSGEVGEAGSHALAGVAVQLHERSRHTRRRRLGGQRELAHQALSIIEGGIRRTALAVAPGGRQLRGRHADLDAARVVRPVPLLDLDPPPRIGALPGAERVARLPGRRIAGAVLAVRPRIARVALLRELVVARLRVRGVDHAEATVELVRLRAEVEDPGADQERGHQAARALAALVAERAVHVVARGVVAAALDVRTLADRPALDAHGVLAGGGGVLGHGEGRDGRRRRLRHTPRVDPGRLRARARRPAAVGVAGADGEAVHARIGGADLHGRRIGRSEARRLVGPRDRLPRNDRRAQWEGRGGGGGGVGGWCGVVVVVVVVAGVAVVVVVAGGVVVVVVVVVTGALVVVVEAAVVVVVVGAVVVVVAGAVLDVVVSDGTVVVLVVVTSVVLVVVSSVVLVVVSSVVLVVASSVVLVVVS